MSNWDILGIGTVTVDDILTVEHYPPPNTKTPVLAKTRQGGGLTGTALVAAARMGARCAFWGVLGTDELSRYSLDALEAEGIDCSPVIIKASASPFHAVLIVDASNGDRNIFFTEGVDDVCEPEIVDLDLVRQCKLLFIDHRAAPHVGPALSLAHECGIPVVADIENLSYPSVEAILPQIDHLIVSQDTARELTGQRTSDRAAAILAQDRACAVVTMGEFGAWYATPAQAPAHVHALRVDAVDTTGCGDVFHGAYAAALVKGEPLYKTMVYASIAAGLKATHLGGRAGIPTWDQVQAIIDGQGA